MNNFAPFSINTFSFMELFFLNYFHHKFKCTFAFRYRISKAAKEKRAANSGGGLFPPLHWSEMGSKGYELVCLNRDSLEEKAEFTSVSSMIVNGLPNAEVTEIIRVQNEYLWQLYSVYVFFS